MSKIVSYLLPFFLLVLPGVPRQTDSAEINRHVRFLAAISPARNHKYPASLDTAARYISAELKKFSVKSRDQLFEVAGKKYRNVIANIGPAYAERIVVGAHYDACGDQPGADDNASGVAGLLLLASYLSGAHTALKYNYELVFYSLEEPPHFRTEYMGSAVHAKSLKADGAQIKYMLSLETIGYFSDKPDSQSYPPVLGWFYPSEGNFIAAVGRRADADLLRSFKTDFQQHSSLKIITLAAPSFVTGIDFSDHLNYWKYGWSAAMVTDTAFMRNHNYHEISDTPDTLDYEKIVLVIRGVFGAVTAL